eukprot:comp11218_c0_seq1/m.5678 comp11218_c0_seq1/g.5678  ORF comp11218_c0_seq1/g.5678 comp11218_c0_seq1/m.5678 type:complete len:236 (-) comp11218_c0_seq1:897-1604(-)
MESFRGAFRSSGSRLPSYVSSPAPRAAWTSQARMSSAAERAKKASSAYSSPLLSRTLNSSTVNGTSRVLTRCNFLTLQRRRSEGNHILIARPIELASVSVESRTGVFRGTIRISKTSYGAPSGVFVRFSLDGWRTYKDVQSTHVADDPDANFFFFTIETVQGRMDSRNADVGDETTLEFAVCCHDGTGLFSWENNNGQNFVACIHVIQQTPQSPRLGDLGRQAKSTTKQPTISVY